MFRHLDGPRRAEAHDECRRIRIHAAEKFSLANDGDLDERTAANMSHADALPDKKEVSDPPPL